MEVDTGNNTHLAPVSLAQTELPGPPRPPTQNSPRGMRDNWFEPSGQFPISFSNQIRYHTHIKLVCASESLENCWKWRERAGKGVGGRQRRRGLAALAPTDYGLTFGAAASEMSDGL